ncbi:MAG: hypothetical protein J6K84_04905 [Oscillospiraceae bacterium]|nr:hypothetical protein [Oscillospiraceae bacterium]
MAQFLEATMLLCFGVSWPISLAKSIQAKTAKTTSVWFILLIMAGYMAGITAKIISHTTGYILVVYFLNLAVVSCNLIVWCMNHSRDRKQEKCQKGETFHVHNAANL